MSENEIIEGLLAKDDRITRYFFYSDKEKSCRPLLLNILKYVFSYPVDYDEAVNEFYAYLLEDDGSRLRKIENRNSFFGWLKVCATRFFIKKRDNLIENRSQEALLEKTSQKAYADEEDREQARKDMLRLLLKMKNKRYAYVLQQLIINGMEAEELAGTLQITTANLYNIKRRAIIEFTRVAENDIKCYGK